MRKELEGKLYEKRLRGWGLFSLKTRRWGVIKAVFWYLNNYSLFWQGAGHEASTLHCSKLGLDSIWGETSLLADHQGSVVSCPGKLWNSLHWRFSRRSWISIWQGRFGHTLWPWRSPPTTLWFCDYFWCICVWPLKLLDWCALVCYKAKE